MKQRQKVYQTFVIFILTSALLLLISPNKYIQSVSGMLEKIFNPLQMSVYRNIGMKSDDDSKLRQLEEENTKLREELTKLNNLKQDFQALKSQFQEIILPSRKLIPAEIIGINSDFFSKDIYPRELILNVGKNQGIRKGLAVISENKLVGVIERVSNERSIVTVLTSEKLSIPVKTSQTNASCIVRNEKNQMVLHDVLLSEKLEMSDTVVTKGNIKEDGTGYPPDLLIGKITSIDKKPSAIFQSARITPFVKVDRLSIVFVYLQ